MLNQNLLLTGDDGYNLTKSLRFRSSASAYLSRTPASAGNRQKWTWSGWVKRGALSSGSYMDLFTALSGANDFTEVRYHFNANDDTIVFTDIASGTTYAVYSTNIYRDPSAWYHIVCSVDTTQATNTNRVKLYVNGVQVTQNAGGSGYPLQNTNTSVNATVEHRHGSVTTYGRYFDGYMTEVNFIDGQALTPSSFGETSTTTGVWIPKKYTGTYGTNGFYLPFTDTTSTSTLGTDFSGNSNTWTVNNISLTAGSTYDSMNDVPTLTSATTANYCVLNPLDGNNATLSGGNLNFVTLATGNANTLGSFYVSTGKWYWEIVGTSNGDISYYGIRAGSSGYYVAYYGSNGNKDVNGSASAYGATYGNNDIIGVALDMDAGTITFYKNNASQGAITIGNSGPFAPWIADGASGSSVTGSINFGQRPFAYTPPTGFVALNTFNLPTPTIGATASSQANKYMDVSLYTGNGSTQSITGVGFQPDFTWIKERNGAATYHAWFDAVRGVTKTIYSNDTSAEVTGTAFTSFNSNGFTLSLDTSQARTNDNGDTYVAWNWKANGAGSTNTAGSITSTVSANTTAGFSIVTYTGTGSNATVGHGLGVAPSMIILKSRSAITDWRVYHSQLNGGVNPANYTLKLNATNAQAADSTIWNNTVPTSTVFSIGANVEINNSGNNYVAYCFAPIAGYSAFGSYVGNGSTDGTFIFTGFRPKYLMMKRTDSTSGWYMWDTSRDTFNVMSKDLSASSAGAEQVFFGTGMFDFLSNGFKSRSSDTNTNANGSPYIYMAFAENPFKYANAR